MLNPKNFSPPEIQNDNLSANQKYRQNHPIQFTLKLERTGAGSLMPDFIGKPIKRFFSSVDENDIRESGERLYALQQEPLVHTELNSVALFVNDLLDLRKVNATGNLILPWNSTFKYNILFYTKFDPIARVEKVSVGVCYTPKWLRENNIPIDIQPYFNVFSNGEKTVGINFTTLPTTSKAKGNSFQKSGEYSGLSEESFSETIPSLNIDCSEISKIEKTDFEEKRYFEKFAKYAEDTSKYLGGKIDKGFLEVVAFRSLQRDKLGYLYIGVILIFVRVVALRVRGRAKIDGLSEKSKRYKITNFILSWSTQNSSLALSFFCYPIASYLTNLLVGSVVVFVRTINTKVPFLVPFFWVFRFIPFRDYVVEFFLYSILFKICIDGKSCISRLSERFFNFLIKIIVFSWPLSNPKVG